jgi:hypothetical protein
MPEKQRDYLASAELSPQNHKVGDAVRLAVHVLMLHPNAYFARTTLIEWQYGAKAFDHDGKVLDKLERIEPELAKVANQAAMSFCAARIASYIYKFDRYGKQSLDEFIEGEYDYARKKVREYYVKGIGKGRERKETGTHKDAEYRTRIDAEFAEEFGGRNVFKLIEEMMAARGIEGEPSEKHTKTEWQELFLNNAALQASRNEIREIFEEETASTPAIEYEERRRDDDAQEPSHSTTSLENDMQKSMMARYGNRHEKDVKVAKEQQIDGEWIPDETTGRLKKVRWHFEQMPFLQFDMSAEELAAAIAALKEHGTPQYVGTPYAPPPPPPEPATAMPDFEEFKAYFLDDRKDNTPKQRIDSQVTLEAMRLYGWEGVDGYRKIFARLGEDYSIKIAAELGEKPGEAGKLTKDALRGMVERGRKALDSFMHSR